MDTYVHLAAGAALGSIVGKWVDAKLFAGRLLSRQTTIKELPILGYGALLTGVLSLGVFSHISMDSLPHVDLLVDHGLLIPNSLWPVREFLACSAVLALTAGITSGHARLIAVAGGIGGALPDIESLLLGTGFLDEAYALSPTHNGMLPHGANIGWPSYGIEYGILLVALYLLFRSRTRGLE